MSQALRAPACVLVVVAVVGHGEVRMDIARENRFHIESDYDHIPHLF